MILTDEERNKFATYLEQLAASSDAIAKQADSMKMNVLAKNQRIEAMSCTIVAKLLRSKETV